MAKRNSRLMSKSKPKPKPKPKPKSKSEGAEEAAREEAWVCPGACLLVCHGMGPKPRITLYDASQQIHRTKVSLEIANKHIAGCQGDWMLALDCTGATIDCCILNAVTMEKFQLPPLVVDYISTFLLSGSPGAADCTAFVITPSTIFYCEIGADQFSKHELGDEIYKLFDRATITIFQGRMYCMDCAYTLHCAQLQDSLSLQFEECIPGYELMDEPVFEGNPKHLLGSCDRLLFVDALDLEMGVRDFQVFGADLSERVWEKVYNIGGDRAIFVDTYRGFSAALPPGGCLQGNSIYYVSEQDWDEEDTNNITFFGYDLKDGFVTTLPPFPFKIRTSKLQWPKLIWLNGSISSHSLDPNPM